MYETKGAGKRMAQSLEEDLQALIETCESEILHTDQLAKAMGGEPLLLREYQEALEIVSAARKIRQIATGQFKMMHVHKRHDDGS